MLLKKWPSILFLFFSFSFSLPLFLFTLYIFSPRYCSGIDINCGCPQKWAMSEGYGSQLLKDPSLVSLAKWVVRLVNSLWHPERFATWWGNVLIGQTSPPPLKSGSIQIYGKWKLITSLKCIIIRKYRKTVELAQRAQHTGVAWITVHGRTPRQRSTSPVDFEAIKLVCGSKINTLICSNIIRFVLGERKCVDPSNCEWRYILAWTCRTGPSCWP